MNQDSNLIKRMKQGDEDAMDAFVRKYYPPVLRYCRYHVSDRETAQDLAQETFENFFAGWRITGFRERIRIISM